MRALEDLGEIGPAPGGVEAEVIVGRRLGGADGLAAPGEVEGHRQPTAKLSHHPR